MKRYVFDFREGSAEQKALLGGKGAGLAEMTNLGLPVPPGFTISTEACRDFLLRGEPAGLDAEIESHLCSLEQQTGRGLGQPADPLLVSVRSGAKFSMPGMMETVLDVGLNDECLDGLAAQVGGDRRFAYDSYRRLLQMFGSTVLGVPPATFATELERLKTRRGVQGDLDLDLDDLSELVRSFKGITLAVTGQEFPQDARRQLRLAVRAVFRSWNTQRAEVYRRHEHIPADLGTAVNVCTMVFGNRGMDSGSGVAFTRDPSTGARGVYGDYLQNAQGEDVVAGIRNTMPLSALAGIDHHSYDELLRVMATLERHYRDLCDIEFTIEHTKLWILQTRVGKRTAEASFRIACQLVDEGTIDLDEALQRTDGSQLAQLMFPRFDPTADRQLVATGVNASPGAAVGRVVFDSATAVERARRGEPVILVRQETTPDDLSGMVAAAGVLTTHGGKTSHAAVVARGMGRACVCGVNALTIDLDERRLRSGNQVVASEGDWLSIDGATGEVFAGAVPVVDAEIVRHLDGGDAPEGDELLGAVHRVLRHADEVRRLRVRANADTPEDALRARRLGAEGIGLCRTEHMFLGDRRILIENLIVAESLDEQEKALAELLPLQRDDFVRILQAMDGLPVTIRLIDPPLHEFLPDYVDLAVRTALRDVESQPDAHEHRLLRAVKRLHEQNPMLGLRGARLGIVIPGLFAMQTRAIMEAAALRVDAGGDPRPEIMVPLVATLEELQLIRADIEAVAAEVALETGVRTDLRVGTMIELPRAAVVAGQIAQAADFFSFGTNDLTQMTWGFSRDDVEASFFGTYLDKDIFAVSPFESLDVAGVGQLIRYAVTQGRATRPDLQLGVCGEHGGDPASIHFFHDVGLDYVSCSPYRIPIARLESGRSTWHPRDREPSGEA